jgi:hypothetical protein
VRVEVYALHLDFSDMLGVEITYFLLCLCGTKGYFFYLATLSFLGPLAHGESFWGSLIVSSP